MKQRPSKLADRLQLAMHEGLHIVYK